MKLQEWCNSTGIKSTHPTTERGASSVVVDQKHPQRQTLWYLDDYVVSTSAGIVVWLVPSRCRR